MFALLLAQNLGLCFNYTYLPEFGVFDLFWTPQISLNSEVFVPKIVSRTGLPWEYLCDSICAIPHGLPLGKRCMRGKSAGRA